MMPHAFGLDIEDRACSVAGSLKPLAALTLAEDRLNSLKGRGASATAPATAAAAAADVSAAAAMGARPLHAQPAAPGAPSRQQAPEGGGDEDGAAPESTSAEASPDATCTGSLSCGSGEGAVAGAPDAGTDRPTASEGQLREALQARLRFRRTLHLALEKLLGFKAPGDLDEAAGYLQAAQAQLQVVRDTARFGAPAGDAMVDSCFDAAVNRPLMSPTPPRRMPVRSHSPETISPAPCIVPTPSSFDMRTSTSFDVNGNILPLGLLVFARRLTYMTS